MIRWLQSQMYLCPRCGARYLHHEEHGHAMHPMSAAPRGAAGSYSQAGELIARPRKRTGDERTG